MYVTECHFQHLFQIVMYNFRVVKFKVIFTLNILISFLCFLYMHMNFMI
jgi:hypothetical protein